MLLLIEPEDLLRWSLSDVLVQEGYVVAEAATVAQALDLLEQRSFDAIVLDLVLPEQTCWILLHALTRLAILPVPLLLLPARVEPPAMPEMQTGGEEHSSHGMFLPHLAWREDLLTVLKRIRPAQVAPDRRLQGGGNGEV
jgi:CheY-like chemotaxis protein